MGCIRVALISFLPVLFLTSCRSNEPYKSVTVYEKEEAKLPRIVAFGDSLTAGLGLPASQSYPAILQKLIEADGYKYEVVNAGVSGDTTAGGLRRIEWSLDGDARFLILELGGNDILRGQPADLLKQNLVQIIEKAQSKNVKVLLAGMEAPVNAGPEYREQIHRAYEDLEKKHQVVFIPFVLKDLVKSENLIQEDGTHPTAEGTRLIAETVYKSLKPLL